MMHIQKRMKPGRGGEPHDRHVAYATSGSAADVARYGQRWIEETGYRDVEGMCVRTAGRSEDVRTFHFVSAMILYNMWIMASILLSYDCGTGRWDGRPVVTASIAMAALMTCSDRVIRELKGPRGTGLSRSGRKAQWH